MKTFFLLLLSCLGALAQTNYVNTNGPIALVTILPTSIVNSNLIAYNVSWPLLVQNGWRQVVFTQSPSNGGVIDSYMLTFTNVGFGQCNMMVAAQHSLAADVLAAAIAADGAWTNRPDWSQLRTEGLTYSNLVWKYSPGHFLSYSNYATTPQTIMSYYSGLASTNAVSVSNTLDFLNATWMLQDFISVAGTSTNFPWRLVR